MLKILCVVAALVSGGCVFNKSPEVATMARVGLNYSSKPRKAEMTQTYVVTNQYTIVVHERAEFKRICLEKFGHSVQGFCDQDKRVIHVPYSEYVTDSEGNPVPDFDSVGHEVWHLWELGGKWHTKSATIPPRSALKH